MRSRKVCTDESLLISRAYNPLRQVSTSLGGRPEDAQLDAQVEVGDKDFSSELLQRTNRTAGSIWCTPPSNLTSKITPS